MKKKQILQLFILGLIFGIIFSSENNSISRIENITEDSNKINSEAEHLPSVKNPQMASFGILGTYDTAGSAHEVALYGNIALIADYDNGLVCVNISDPGNPTYLGTFNTDGLAMGVDVAGGIAYISDYTNGLVCINITNPSNPNLLGTCSGLGYTEAVTVVGPVAYIAAGYGLYCVNVSNPSNPTPIGSYITADYKRSVVLRGNIAYIAGDNAVDIINVTNPWNPTLLSSYTSVNYAEDVDISGNLAYIADVNVGIQILNISNPKNPIYINTFSMSNYLHAIQIDGDLAYLACELNGLKCVNISDPMHPILVATHDTPDIAEGLTVRGNIIYLADFNSGLHCIRIAQYISPELRSTYDTIGGAYTFETYGNIGYLADYQGVQIFNISNPRQIQYLNNYPTGGECNGVKASGNLLYVADGAYGIKILNISNPIYPVQIGFYDTTGQAISLDLSGNALYVSDGGAGVHVFNVSNPTSPELKNTYNTNDWAVSIKACGDRLYCADGANGGLYCFNISNPWNLQYLSNYNSPGNAERIEVYNYDLVYMGDTTNGVILLNFSYPTSPQVAKQITTTDAHAVRVFGSYLLVADGNAGVRIFNNTNIMNPVQIGYIDTPGLTVDLKVYRDCVFASEGTTGLHSIQFFKYEWEFVPAAPVLTLTTPNPDTDGNNIGLDWNDVDGATSYSVYRDNKPINTLIGLSPIATPSSSTYTDNGLTEGKYFYVVTAVNASGESGFSNCENVSVFYPLNQHWNTSWVKTGNQYSEDIHKVNDSIYICSRDGTGTAGYLIRYDLSGNQIWNITESVPFYAIWANDSIVYVAGNIGNQGHLYKYTSSGSLIWHKIWIGNYANTDIRDLFGYDNEIYMCGHSWDGGNSQGYLTKWADNGTNLWNQSVILYPICFMAIWANESTVYVAADVSANRRIYAYTSTGTPLWNKNWVGGNTKTVSIWSDGSSAIYTTSGDDGVGAGGYDAVLRKYTITGDFLWYRTWGGASTDVPYEGTQPINSSYIYMCGYTNSFGGSYNIFISIWTLEGEQLWNATWGYSGIEWSAPYFVDNNTIYIASDSDKSGNNDIYLIKYSKYMGIAAPILQPITPNPDLDGNGIVIDWNDVIDATSYNVYRTNSSIGTVYNLSAIATVGTSDFTDNGLLNGTYYYVVVAINGSGFSNISNCVWVLVEIPQVGFPPSAPSLSAIIPTTNTDGNVTLNWSPVSGATAYKVYNYTGWITEINGSVNLLTTTGLLTYAHFPLINGTYYYVIVAMNASGDSDISNCEYVIVAIPPPPQFPPAAPSLSAIIPPTDTDGNVTLSWSPSPGALGYKVYNYTGPIYSINGSVNLLTTTGLLTYAHFPLINGTYYYVVVAYNASGDSVVSNCEYVTVAIPPIAGVPPETPVVDLIVPNPDPDGNVTISWNALSYVDYYRIYNYTGPIFSINGSVNLLGTTGNNWYDHFPLINGTYYYAVVAFNASGNSTVSNWVNVTVAIPPAPKYPPSAPVLNAITPNPDSDGNIQLTWNNVPGAITYNVYRYSGLITVLNGSVLYAGGSGGANYYNISSLSNGTYYFVVTAVNSSGESIVSNCVSVTVAIPPPPTITPMIIILKPINNTVFKSGFDISLQFQTSGASFTMFWAAFSDADEWTNITGNTTMDVSKPGTYRLRVRGFTGTENITSEVCIFYVVIEVDPKAQLLFTISTTATEFKRGTSIEIRVEITNNGTVNFNRLYIRFFQNGPYAIRTNEQKWITQVIAPGDSVSYTINLFIYQDTQILNFEIDLMADNYYNHLSLQLNTLQPEGTNMTAILTYVGGGAGAAGVAVVTVKMVRGMKSKKDSKPDKNEPKPGDDKDQGKNSDVEFKF